MMKLTAAEAREYLSPEATARRSRVAAAVVDTAYRLAGESGTIRLALLKDEVQGEHLWMTSADVAAGIQAHVDANHLRVNGETVTTNL